MKQTKIMEYRIYDRIDRPFYGDCEDAAFTLQKQIGGDVWYVLLNNGTAHAALVKNGIVYDNRKGQDLRSNQITMVILDL